MMSNSTVIRYIRFLCIFAGMYILAFASSKAQEIEGDSCIVAACNPAADEVAPFGSTVPKGVYMAVKTNMLYDVLTVPNVSFEAYLGRNISVSAQWMYAWWSKERSRRYFRIYGGEISGRYWPGNAAGQKPLTGHHVGIYVGAYTFDFQWGKTAYIGGRPGHTLWDRCMLNVGIEYGYSLPVGKHLNLDFTLGVGYFGGIIEKFKPGNDEYYTEHTISRHRWFGPNKAEISLVWLIGKNIINQRKGGGK